MDISAKLESLSRAELEEILSNEDKINQFALESELIKTLQLQRDRGKFYIVRILTNFDSDGIKSNSGK